MSENIHPVDVLSILMTYSLDMFYGNHLTVVDTLQSGSKW